jgi:phage/plasmid-like protein (TIGR03299 family)
MAHELEIQANGQARMMYAGQAPWHGLGTSVEREVTSAAALKLAALDNWNMQLVPVEAILADGSRVTMPNDHAIVRGMDGAVYGIAGDHYTVIQNEEACAFLDSLVGEGVAMFHTAGSLFGGRRVFVCCKMPDSIQVGPDKIDKYLVAIWGHDGAFAFHIKWTGIRVVCWNTASAAFCIRGGKVRATDAVSIMHTRGWKDRATEVREVLDLTNAYYARLEECFQKLIATPLRESDFTTFVKKLYPDQRKKEGEGVIDRSEIRETLRTIWHTGIGLDHEEVKGTRWAAYNAVTEYIDHHRKYNDGKYGDVADIRMNSVIWGQGSQIKKQALDLLAV